MTIVIKLTKMIQYKNKVKVKFNTVTKQQAVWTKDNQSLKANKAVTLKNLRNQIILTLKLRNSKNTMVL